MKNIFKALSFQSMFLFSFLIFTSILLLIFGITSYYITNQEIVNQTIHSRKLLLNEINKQLTAQMQSIEYDSLAISSSPHVINYLQFPEDSYERIESDQEILGDLSRPSYIKNEIHSIQLYAKNRRGSLQIGANGVYSYDSIRQTSWYGQISNADNCWVGAHQIEVESYPTNETTVVTYARKILSASGKEIGILVINVKLSAIQHIVSAGSVDFNRYIIDSSNRLITEIVDQREGQNSYINHKDKIGKILDQSMNEQFSIFRLNKKELIIWSKQNKSGWITMDMIPWNSMVSGSKKIEKVIVGSGLICIILAAIMALLLSRQFVKPIRKLIQVMNQVKVGNLNLHISNQYQNEFGNLYNHFNHMISRIQHLMEQVNEEHRKKREAELQVLQAQINPHFIYNTLDIINWHSIDHGAHEISRMLSLLGKMLRIGLSKGASFIPIQLEIQHLVCYIELQKIRYQHNISFSINIPESIESYFIPKLVIQPFVENSIMHGIGNVKEGDIKIIGEESGNDIIFTIMDNGKGMERHDLNSPAVMLGGIRNVHDRIKMYYGQEYGVGMESEVGAGTVMTIRIPKIAHNLQYKGRGA